MTISLYNDQTGTSTDTYTKVGEVEQNGFRISEFSNITVTGKTLASAVNLRIGMKLPKDLVKGIVNNKITLRAPLANRLDGSARFIPVNIEILAPADATYNELRHARLMVWSLLNQTEVANLIESHFTPT